MDTPIQSVPEERPTKHERWLLRKEEKEHARTAHIRTRTAKRVALWGVSFIVLAALVGGIVWLVSQENAAASGSLAVPIGPDDWSKGNASASVTLVEYSDFQCPACGAYFSILKEVEKTFGDRLKLIYRHFPLKNVHPNAEPAARAAEASGRQGKFWEMHDLLFENQTAWSGLRDPEETFAGYADRLGLDRTQFLADFKGTETAVAVQSDYDGGFASRVNATPTFFLDSRQIPNPRTYDEFKAIVEQALAAGS